MAFSSANRYKRIQPAIEDEKDSMEPLDIGPPAHLYSINSKEYSVSDAYVHTMPHDYTLKENSCSNLTRMSQDRDMIIGCWSKGILKHSSIFICYFSEFEKRQQLIGRLFCIELLPNKENKAILSIKGPLYSPHDYSCKQFYNIHTNMDTLLEIAKETMHHHGKYRKFCNNCNHFTKNYLKNVKKEFNLLKVGLSKSKINGYLGKYVPKNTENDGSGGLVIDGDEELYQNENLRDKSNAKCMEQIASVYVDIDSHEFNTELIQFAKPISFTQAFTKYPL